MKGKLGTRLGLVLALVMVLIGGLWMGLGKQPAEVEAAGVSYPVTISNAGAIAADTTYSARIWDWDGNDKTSAEIWYSIDQGTTNTTTLYLDVSPDNSLWKTAYATILSANAADATGYTTATIAGRYFRLRADVANTNTITITLKALYR